MNGHHLSFWLKLESGKNVELEKTPELVAELEKWAQAFDCEHERTTLVRCRVMGGGEQIREQCDWCGEMVTQPQKRASIKNVEALPFDDRDRLGDFCREREHQNLAILRRHYKMQQQEGGAAYQRYLQSEQWADRRARVLERANGLCEGCRACPPQEVHHLTYRHIRQEFLFELVALCRTCHERWHSFEDE